MIFGKEIYMKTRLSLLILGLAAVAFAKVDLVTLPVRDTVQLTIYNSADMTLVRDGRSLTLVNGVNKLQFSWANTLIDPTSLELVPKKDIDKIDVIDLEYPARVRELGVWNVKSGVSGTVPVEITYLTSGLNWRAFYLATLAHDEKTMRLEGYVRVTNSSGEDYENAQTRLIVGKVHMLDEIAMLARRAQPYGSPVPLYPREEEMTAESSTSELKARPAPAASARMMFREVADKPKEITKEGLSEYFLYTIEGTETIPNGWSKRMPSFDVAAIPVTNLYKFELERYGNEVVRFLSFKNSTTHNLGQTPIPDGAIKVCRTEDEAQHLSYQGQSSFKYIPVDEEVELNLGPVANVTVEPTLMDFKTLNYEFDKDGNVCGWDEVREYRVEVKNTRDVPVRVEIQRNFPTTKWALEKKGDIGQYEKVDMDTVKFCLDVAASSSNVFNYTLTTKHGTRE
jgi:hypothetical protein